MKRKFPFGSASSDDVPEPEPQGQGLLSSILKSLNSLPTNVFTTKLTQQTQDAYVDEEEEDTESVEKENSSPKPIIKNPLNHLTHVTKPRDYKITGKAALHANELFSIQKKIEKLSLLKMSEEYLNNEATETELSPSNKSVSKFSEPEPVLEETMMNIESESEPQFQEEGEPSVVSSILASAASKQSFQKNKSEEKTKSPVPVFEKINVEKRDWTDQEIEAFFEVASKLTRSITKKENRGNIHEKINTEFKKKGIDTELQIYDVMQRLNEDLVKIKKRIAYKNEKYKHFNSYLALDDIKNDDNDE